MVRRAVGCAILELGSPRCCGLGNHSVWEVQKEDSCRRFEQKMEASYTEYDTHHTDRALRVVEQTFVTSLAQLYGTKTIKKVSIYC
uniref:NTMC2T3 n=1 Tax=Arundo donax TaxID=35708 RepID=A0A0A9FN49_ARUDO